MSYSRQSVGGAPAIAGMKDVRPPQHRQRGQVPAERPAPDADPGQVQVGALLGGRLQRLDLVLQDRAGQVAGDRAVPLGPAAGGAAAVGDDDGEALLGEPLRAQVRGAGGQHALAVRAAVGVAQHRQLARAWLVPGRQQDRGPDPARPG